MKSMLEVGEDVGMHQDDGSIEHTIVYSVKGPMVQVISNSGDEIINIDLRETPHKLQLWRIILPIVLSKRLIKQLLSASRSKNLDEIENFAKVGKILQEFIEYILVDCNFDIDDDVSILVNAIFDKSRAEHNCEDKDIEDA